MRVHRPSGVNAFTSVSTHQGHTCALTDAGTAYCWGSGASGQLGTGQFGYGGFTADSMLNWDYRPGRTPTARGTGPSLMGLLPRPRSYADR
ncbi:hypothetical protein ACFSC4_29245 [Deinococcus malanensis]|uniref:hypothetical protein n=1 Tax=Deinococcus malanensis TaxID=1706855 RepID=UPI003638181E